MTNLFQHRKLKRLEEPAYERVHYDYKADLKGVFDRNDKLTELGLAACKANQIDPCEIAEINLESFRRPGISTGALNKLYACHKKKRQGILHLI